MLSDSDKYVRYGAAISLEKLQWEPKNDLERAYLYLGKQDWDALATLGEAAIKPLNRALKDRHPDVRAKVMEVIGQIGCERGISTVIRGLGDENPNVRWKAALAGPKCGIPHMYLPRGLNKRPRVRKNPRIAGFLNFILPGQGYNYLGIWWGTLVFQLDVTITLYMLSFGGEDLTYTLMLPLYGLFALHAWYIARKMPEL
jgi:FOG: HEAT repeat